MRLIEGDSMSAKLRRACEFVDFVAPGPASDLRRRAAERRGNVVEVVEVRNETLYTPRPGRHSYEKERTSSTSGVAVMYRCPPGIVP